MVNYKKNEKNKIKPLQPKLWLTDGSFTTNNFVINSKFDDVSVNIDPNLANMTPHPNLSPLNLLGRPSVNSIFLFQLTSLEVNSILSSLTNGAVGHDELSGALLKLVSPSIVNPPVTFMSLISRTGVSQWVESSQCHSSLQGWRSLSIQQISPCYVLYQRFLKRLRTLI